VVVVMPGGEQGRVMQQGGRLRRRDEVMPRARAGRVRAPPVAAAPAASASAVRRRRRRPGRPGTALPDAELVPVGGGGGRVEQAESALEASRAQALVETAQYVDALHRPPTATSRRTSVYLSTG